MSWSSEVNILDEDHCKNKLKELNIENHRLRCINNRLNARIGLILKYVCDFGFVAKLVSGKLIGKIRRQALKID